MYTVFIGRAVKPSKLLPSMTTSDLRQQVTAISKHLTEANYLLSELETILRDMEDVAVSGHADEQRGAVELAVGGGEVDHQRLGGHQLDVAAAGVIAFEGDDQLMITRLDGVGAGLVEQLGIDGLTIDQLDDIGVGDFQLGIGQGATCPQQTSQSRHQNSQFHFISLNSQASAH